MENQNYFVLYNKDVADRVTKAGQKEVKKLCIKLKRVKLFA